MPFPLNDIHLSSIMRQFNFFFSNFQGGLCLNRYGEIRRAKKFQSVKIKSRNFNYRARMSTTVLNVSEKCIYVSYVLISDIT